MKLIEVLSNNDEKLFIKQLKKDCSEALAIYKKYNCVLIRGTKAHNEENFFIKNVPTKREGPLNSDPIVIDILEAYRKINFPEKPTRKSGLFCHKMRVDDLGSDDYSGLVSEYGKEFVIFPVNNSKFFQSKLYFDFYDSALYEKIYDLKTYFNKIDYILKDDPEIKIKNKRVSTAINKITNMLLHKKILPTFFIYLDEIIKNNIEFEEDFVDSGNMKKILKCIDETLIKVQLKDFFTKSNNSLEEIMADNNTVTLNSNSVDFVGLDDHYAEVLINTKKYYAIRMNLLETL